MKQILVALCLSIVLVNPALAWCIFNCDRDNFISACVNSGLRDANAGVCGCTYDELAHKFTGDQIKLLAAQFSKDQKTTAGLQEKHDYMWMLQTLGELQAFMVQMRAEHACGQ